jgi:hypothetical protein
MYKKLCLSVVSWSLFFDKKRLSIISIQNRNLQGSILSLVRITTVKYHNRNKQSEASVQSFIPWRCPWRHPARNSIFKRTKHTSREWPSEHESQNLHKFCKFYVILALFGQYFSHQICVIHLILRLWAALFGTKKFRIN